MDGYSQDGRNLNKVLDRDIKREGYDLNVQAALVIHIRDTRRCWVTLSRKKMKCSFLGNISVKREEGVSQNCIYLLKLVLRSRIFLP
jgi:hypothetical protein